jgi:hypothetical protein
MADLADLLRESADVLNGLAHGIADAADQDWRRARGFQKGPRLGRHGSSATGGGEAEGERSGKDVKHANYRPVPRVRR